MNLAIFDIDGTLLDTNKVDWACYARALQLYFRQSEVNTNWQEYRYTTDSGIFQEIFRKAFSRCPESREVKTFQDSFLGLLKETCRNRPALFSEVPGASEMLQRLSKNEDWAIGLATGGWYAPAVFKLKCAGIHCPEQVISTADDALAREDILANCILKAKTFYERDGFSKIVSIGDGVWDVRAAASMHISFIGIGDTTLLNSEGAEQVIRDFRDVEFFMGLLEDSRPPRL